MPGRLETFVKYPWMRRLWIILGAIFCCLNSNELVGDEPSELLPEFASLYPVDDAEEGEDRLALRIHDVVIELDPQEAFEFRWGAYETIPTTESDVQKLFEQHAKRFRHVTDLSFRCSKLDASSLKLFSSLTNVRNVDLQGLRPEPFQITSLQTVFPKLDSLALNIGKFTSSDFQEFGTLKKLKSLTLRSSSPLPHDALGELSKLSSLETLHLSCDSVSDVDFAGLEVLPSLRELSIHGRTFSEELFRYIGSMRSLQRLVLRFKWIPEGHVKHLAGLDELKILDLDDTRLTNEALLALRDLKNLQTLKINRNFDITDAGLGVGGDVTTCWEFKFKAAYQVA